MHVKKAKNVESEVLETGKGISRQMLIGSDEGPNFAMRKLVVEPGGSVPSHTSAAEHEQHVLGGRAKVGIGDRVYEVEKDDVVFIPAGEPHWYEAHGEELFELLSVVPTATTIWFLRNRFVKSQRTANRVKTVTLSLC